MRIAELQEVAKLLEEPAHLVIWVTGGRFEVVAVAGEEFEDAFPLPLSVQTAAAEAGLVLDTTTAARVEIEKMPDDFWEDLEEVDYPGNLTVSMLGRAGSKYLEVYHAVRAGGNDIPGERDLTLAGAELLKVTRWLREASVFDHHWGDRMMEVLTRMGR